MDKVKPGDITPTGSSVLRSKQPTYSLLGDAPHFLSVSSNDLSRRMVNATSDSKMPGKILYCVRQINVEVDNGLELVNQQNAQVLDNVLPLGLYEGQPRSSTGIRRGRLLKWKLLPWEKSTTASEMNVVNVQNYLDKNAAV